MCSVLLLGPENQAALEEDGVSASSGALRCDLRNQTEIRGQKNEKSQEEAVSIVLQPALAHGHR